MILFRYSALIYTSMSINRLWEWTPVFQSADVSSRAAPTSLCHSRRSAYISGSRDGRPIFSFLYTNMGTWLPSDRRLSRSRVRTQRWWWWWGRRGKDRSAIVLVQKPGGSNAPMHPEMGVFFSMVGSASRPAPWVLERGGPTWVWIRRKGSGCGLCQPSSGVSVGQKMLSNRFGWLEGEQNTSDCELLKKNKKTNDDVGFPKELNWIK